MQNQELRDAQQELEASRLQYLELFRSIPLACFTLTERGVIAEANPATEELFGMPGERLAGYPISLLVEADDHPRFFASLGRLRRGDAWAKQDFSFKGASRRIDGLTDCRLVSLPREDKGDILVTITDVTHLKALERDLHLALRTKERFLAAAAHDLRQPVQALHFLVEQLVRDRQDGPESITAMHMKGSIGALAAMLDSLMDLSRLDAGLLKPAMTSLRLGPLMRQLHAEFGPLAEQKGIRLKTVPTDMTVEADPVMTERICRNLLSNALRYTKSGRILFGVRRQGASVHLEVWDTGIGIAPEQIDRIFQDFVQVGSAVCKPHEGLGLGLSITKRLAEAMGGAISVRSSEGKGSCFAIVLRMTKESKPEPAAPARSSAAPAAVAGRRVLLVEDDAIIRLTMEACLSEWGCEVTSVASGDEALDAIGAGLHPDLLLTDFRLPGSMNGIEIVNALRARLQRPLPGIILSGDTEVGRLLSMQASGCHLLHKPFAPDRLLAAIESALVPA